MALVAISYPIEGLALLGWLAQVLEKVLSKSLVELPLQLIGILVFDWQGTASRKAVPPNPHPDFLVCNVCWIELLPYFPLLPSCLGEPMIAPLSRRVGTSNRNGFLHLVVLRDSFCVPFFAHFLGLGTRLLIRFYLKGRTNFFSFSTSDYVLGYL
ncbi:hypothetical protein AHAS_Ahas19G0362200 [Arachis hypogaea]